MRFRIVLTCIPFSRPPATMTGSHRHHRRVGNGMRTSPYWGPGLLPPGSRTTSAGAEPPCERSERSFWSTPAHTPCGDPYVFTHRFIGRPKKGGAPRRCLGPLTSYTRGSQMSESGGEPRGFVGGGGAAPSGLLLHTLQSLLRRQRAREQPARTQLIRR